jgi:hypothetical protein
LGVGRSAADATASAGAAHATHDVVTVVITASGEGELHDE